MTLTAWEISGLDADYWEKHALDIRIRLAAAGYLGGDWNYSLTKPKVLYDMPDEMRANSLEISELELKDGDNRVTNCSTMTASILTSVYPSAPWSVQDYGDLQVFGDRLPAHPDSPIRAVERVGVGQRVGLLMPGRWHLVQGWRRFDPNKPSYSGHAFLVLADDNGDVDQVLEATSIDNIGPRYKRTTLEGLRKQYPKGLHLAVLNSNVMTSTLVS
jgi:hypothetical protein